METHCSKCKTKTKNEDIAHTTTSNGRSMQLSRCKICKGKKALFISINNGSNKKPLTRNKSNESLSKSLISKILKMYNNGQLNEILNLLQTSQITKQEGKGLLGNLFGFQLPDNVKNIPLLGPLLNFIA